MSKKNQSMEMPKKLVINVNVYVNDGHLLSEALHAISDQFKPKKLKLKKARKDTVHV